jgi:hypothetical protein
MIFKKGGVKNPLTPDEEETNKNAKDQLCEDPIMDRAQ